MTDKSLSSYLSHWGLDAPPFAPGPDTRFLRLFETHRQALARLQFVAETRQEGMVLTGPAGSGKTVLARALRQRLTGEAFRVVYVPGWPDAQSDVFATIAHQMALQTPDGEAEWSGLVARSLSMVAERGQHPVVILDDAHMIDRVRLSATVGLLQAGCYEEGGRVTLILVGRFASTAPDPLADRLPFRFGLTSLSPDESIQYITQRLIVAGGRGDTFDGDALGRLAELADGVPRTLSRLADVSLHIGHLTDATQIDRDVIDRAAQKMAPVEGAPTVRASELAEPVPSEV